MPRALSSVASSSSARPSSSSVDGGLGVVGVELRHRPVVQHGAQVAPQRRLVRRAPQGRRAALPAASANWPAALSCHRLVVEPVRAPRRAGGRHSAASGGAYAGRRRAAARSGRGSGSSRDVRRPRRRRTAARGDSSRDAARGGGGRRGGGLDGGRRRLRRAAAAVASRGHQPHLGAAVAQLAEQAQPLRRASRPPRRPCGSGVVASTARSARPALGQAAQIGKHALAGQVVAVAEQQEVEAAGRPSAGPIVPTERRLSQRLNRRFSVARGTASPPTGSPAAGAAMRLMAAALARRATARTRSRTAGRWR